MAIRYQPTRTRTPGERLTQTETAYEALVRTVHHVIDELTATRHLCATCHVHAATLALAVRAAEEIRRQGRT